MEIDGDTTISVDLCLMGLVKLVYWESGKLGNVGIAASSNMFHPPPILLLEFLFIQFRIVFQEPLDLSSCFILFGERGRCGNSVASGGSWRPSLQRWRSSRSPSMNP